MKYDLVRPCDNCPFRRDVVPYLTTARAREIAFTEGEFPCHKTTVEDESSEDGGNIATEDSKHCAGFLIMRENAGHPNQMMRILERIRVYDRTRLDMDSPVYDGPDEMVEAYADHNNDEPFGDEDEVNEY
jgi:hypothetical protein